MRNERNYAWTELGEDGREEASGGEREQRREVEEQLREDRVHTTFLSKNSRPFQGLFKVLLFLSRLNRIGKTLDLLQNACRSKNTFLVGALCNAIKQWER